METDGAKTPGRYISGASGLPVERLGPGGKGLEAAEKRRLQKENEKRADLSDWFDRRRYNYIDYEIGLGNVEVGFTCIIKQGMTVSILLIWNLLRVVPSFRMLTEDLRLNTALLDTFMPLVKAHYLDFIDRFEAGPCGDVPSGLRPLYPTGRLQLVHSCG